MFARAVAPDPVAEMAAAVASLADVDPGELSDDELSDALVALARHKATFEAATARLTSAWDARGVWSADGARSGAAWLAHKTRTPSPAARRQVRLAREVRTMPVAETAWINGEIGADHVSRLAGVCNERTESVFERDEAMLVGHAKRLSFRHFERALAYWKQHADPDGAELDARRVFEQRHLHSSQMFDGSWRVNANLDRVGGAEFHTQLQRIEQELFDADWAAAKAEHGDAVSLDKLARTPAQRRADALVEMAKRAATAPKDGKRPRPLVTFLVNYDDPIPGRIAELANGTPVTLGQVAEIIRDADIERAVFGPDRRVIDLGRASRLFTGAARRALEVTHRECSFPLCEDNGPNREANHIIPWEDGGATDQTNGDLPCDPHHDLAYKRRAKPFTVHRDENGVTHWYRPDGTEIT